MFKNGFTLTELVSDDDDVALDECVWHFKSGDLRKKTVVTQTVIS